MGLAIECDHLVSVKLNTLASFHIIYCYSQTSITPQRTQKNKVKYVFTSNLYENIMLKHYPIMADG